MRLAEKLTMLSRQRNLSDRKIARLVSQIAPEDVSDSTVRRWRIGDGTPSLRYALCLARVLDVPLLFLADDELDSPAVHDGDKDLDYLVHLAQRMGVNRAIAHLSVIEAAASAEPIERPRRGIETTAPGTVPPKAAGKQPRKSG